MLKESGFGVSGGSDDEMSPGFGFKKETYNTFGKERKGSIEEQSKLFGRDYSYRFDFRTFREAVRKASEGAGYRFEVKLMEKSVRETDLKGYRNNDEGQANACPFFCTPFRRSQTPRARRQEDPLP